MECLARGHDVLHCEARCHMKIFVMLLRVLDSFKLSFDLKSIWIHWSQTLELSFRSVDDCCDHERMRLC